jgi:hypothetical protein
MRDLWIHDNDLIVATHGRSFWILDDVTPLREASAAMMGSTHLFHPAPAHRIQRDTYTDTPLPPDEPMAANPPDGAVIDYYLPAPASSVAIEILDAQGKVVRRYTNTDKPEVSDEDLQKQLIPLYWVRKPHRLSTEAGMHRWIWDLHYPAPTVVRHDYPIAAVPHDTPRGPLGPAALPGTYAVRLTVDGKSSTVPLTVKMDPRVKTPPAGLQRKFNAETRLASMLSDSSRALIQGGSIREQMGKMAGAGQSASAAAVQDCDKKLAVLLGAPAASPAPQTPELTLRRANNDANTLYQAIWLADAEPTSSQMEALARTEKDVASLLQRWNEFKQSDLPALNRALRESKAPEIQLEPEPHHEEPQVDEE